MDVKQINITLGTAGHIDHGKTSLVKLLTGCDTDRLKAEKERGMSIDLGFAPCKIVDCEVGIVDVPGHENFIKTMVAGASGMDAVMLVVAADDGVMPQTREHMEILTLLGVRHGMVALSKIDRVDPDHRRLVEEETRGFLQGTFLDGAPICPVSSTTGEGFDEFFTTLRGLLQSLEPKPTGGVFRLPVDRAFSAHGYGAIVAGIPTSGSARVEDEVVLLPEGLQTRIRHIEVYGRPSDVVQAGQCAAINLRQGDAGKIKRGRVLATPGFFDTRPWLIAELRLLRHEKLLLKHATKVKLHTGTSEVTALVHLLDADRMRPGETRLVQFRPEAPLIVGPGDRFIIRALSPVRTIGGGVLIEAVDRKLRRNRPAMLDDLRRRRAAIDKEAFFVEYALEQAASGAATEADLAARTKTQPTGVREILGELTEQGRAVALPVGGFVHRETLRARGERILELVDQFHEAEPQRPGLPVDELRQKLDGEDRHVLDAAISELARQGRLVQRDGRLASPRHVAVFQGEDAALGESIESLFREAPFAPPGIDRVCSATGAPRPKVEKLIKTLQEHGRLVRVDGGILFHAEAVARAKERLVQFIQEKGRLESVEFKYLLDTTRKYAIPLLDYFDAIGVTRRVGKTRHLKERK